MGCTFCAIPQFRGRHRSRPLADIVAEVEGLARARRSRRRSWSPRTRSPTGATCPGNGDIGDLLLALSDTRDAVDPADVPASRRTSPTGSIAKWRARARGARTSTCRSSTATTASCAPCAAASPRGACRTSSRGSATRIPGVTAPHHRARRLPGRDRGRVPEPARVPGGRGASTASASSPTRPRRARRPPTWPDQVPAEVMAERAAAGPGDSRTGSPGRARRRSSARARPCWWTARARIPRSPSRAGPPGQAPEIDGVVLLRDRAARARALRGRRDRRGRRLRARRRA